MRFLLVKQLIKLKWPQEETIFKIVGVNFVDCQNQLTYEGMQLGVHGGIHSEITLRNHYTNFGALICCLITKSIRNQTYLLQWYYFALQLEICKSLGIYIVNTINVQIWQGKISHESNACILITFQN